MARGTPDKKFGYRDGNSIVQWEVADIWKAAEGIKPVTRSMHLFKGQMKKVQSRFTASDKLRVENADVSYPIIISSSDLIIDGYHRLTKLEAEGKTTVECVVLKEMPTPCHVKGKPFTVPGLPPFEWKHK